MSSLLLSENMPRLPEELYLDILLNLPVKSLLTCKYVCKSWYQLISDPSFVESHLNLMQKKNPGLILITNDAGEGFAISTLSYQSLRSSSPVEDLNKNCIELDYPGSKFEQYVQLVGSCNGLVCLWLQENDKVGSFCVWNPATTEYKIIPNLPNKRLSYCATFGYDYVADDYMLVNFVGSDSLPVVVYTLRSNSWKIIQADSYDFQESGYGIFVKGAFHLLIETREPDCYKVIIRLDMRTESFTELQLPKEALENSYTDVGVLDESLCLLAFVPQIGWEVWVLQHNGVRQSWSKSFVLNDSIIKNDRFLRMVRSFQTGEVLLLFMLENLVLYDVVHAISGEPKRVKNMYGIENYVESLVSLNSGLYVKKRKKSRSIIDKVIAMFFGRTIR